MTAYSCDFMLFPEPPRLLTSSTTISGPQIADAQQHESCRKMTPTQPSAAKSSLLGIDKLAELSMAKSIRRLFHPIFSCSQVDLGVTCLAFVGTTMSSFVAPTHLNHKSQSIISFRSQEQPAKLPREFHPRYRIRGAPRSTDCVRVVRVAKVLT